MDIAVLADAYERAVICIFYAYGRSSGIAVDVYEGGAILERPFSNARYGVGDGDGGEGGAIRERPVSNARYGVGDGG